MATLVAIGGESGTGKSTSIRSLPADSTALIKIVEKTLPFRGGLNFPSVVTDNAENIRGWIRRIKANPKIKVCVIDDFQYLMANEYMSSILEPKTKDSEFQKYKSIGFNAWSVIREAQNCRPDQVFFFLSHTETDLNGFTRLKTIGKVMEDKITLEGLFTLCLNTAVHTEKQHPERYVFQTQNNGANRTKTPIEMFDAEEIPNDLNLVYNTIISYYGG
jgi:hypothetical protein